MKRIYKIALLNVSFLAAVVSFQNCSKVQPDLLIDDKMAASGAVSPELTSAPVINTDNIQPGTEVVVDQPMVAPDVTPVQVLPQPVVAELPDDECPNKGKGGGKKNRESRNNNSDAEEERTSKSESEDEDQSEIANHDQDEDTNENEIEDAEKENDENVCKSGGDADDKVVVLDESNKVFDGSVKTDNGKPTYIFSEASDIEIRNTRGKTIVCNCKVKKIENNVGKLVLVNSVVNEVDQKRGNLTLVDSTASQVTNMKGVIKK